MKTFFKKFLVTLGFIPEVENIVLTMDGELNPIIAVSSINNIEISNMITYYDKELDSTVSSVYYINRSKKKQNKDEIKEELKKLFF